MAPAIINCLRNKPHQSNTPSSIHQIHLPLNLRIPPFINKKEKETLQILKSWKKESEECMLTSCLPRSSAASLNIFLFPDLLPQNTQTLVSFPMSIVLYSLPRNTRIDHYTQVLNFFLCILYISALNNQE